MLRLMRGDAVAEPTDSWEIQYELSESDFVAFARAHARRTWWHWLVMQLVIVYWMIPFVALAGFVGLIVAVTGGRLTWSRFILVVVAGYMLINTIMWLRNRPKRMIEMMLKAGHGRSALGRQQLAISSQGLSWKGVSGHQFLRWFAILRVQVIPSHAFFYLDPYRAYIVPSRAFGSVDEFARFVESAREYQERNQDYGLVCPKCGQELHPDVNPGCPECGWRREGGGTSVT